METETLLDKSQIIESFGNLPDQVTADQLIERILFIRLINERIRETETQSGTTHKDFMREFDEYKSQLKTAKKHAIS